MVIQLNGKITEEGTLELDLPAGLPVGEARITLEIPSEPAWTTADLDRVLETTPMTGAEIVKAGLVGGWESAGIDDGSRWVEEQRQARHGRRNR